jgi:hypothetical protein
MCFHACNFLQTPFFMETELSFAQFKSALIRLLTLPTGATFEEQKAAIGDDVLGYLEPSELEQLETVRVVAKGKKKTKKIEEVPVRALRQEEEEKVRQVLREALTEEDLKAAIDMAKKLEMGFEVSLGEKKLEKFATVTSTRE